MLFQQVGCAGRAFEALQDGVILRHRHRTLRAFELYLLGVRHRAVASRIGKRRAAVQDDQPCEDQRATPATHLDEVTLLEMITSTRRFCWRPVAESLPATGEDSPMPEAANLPLATPCPTR